MQNQQDKTINNRRNRRSNHQRVKRTIDNFAQLPFEQPKAIHQPVNIISEDNVQAIHSHSMDILEKIGIEILSPRAISIFKKAGARIDGERVYVGRDIIEHAIKTAPSQFILYARNPAHNVIIGGDYMAFAMSASAPNSCDLDNGRRPSNSDDFKNLTRLAQLINSVHCMSGYPVEPQDWHVRTRHLHAMYHHAVLTDKSAYIYVLDRQMFEDAAEMIKIIRQIDHAQFCHEPSLLTIVNTNSPLKIDGPMADGIIDFAAYGQASCITPFTLAGAMAPVSLPGALAQQNAEALFGIALSQMVKAGAPVIYGGFTSNVDMKSGAPAFGTPEFMKANIITGQLTRYYNIPYRTSVVNATNIPDAQAAYETVFSLWSVVNGRGNLIKHAHGWMEGGLHTSYEKVIIDAAINQMAFSFMKPLSFSEDEFAFDAIQDVGPGGHFFGTAHTLERFENAFHAPILSDWRTYQNWQSDGGLDSYKRANHIWKELLSNYKEPYFDSKARGELEEFYNKRIDEGGIKTD